MKLENGEASPILDEKKSFWRIQNPIIDNPFAIEPWKGDPNKPGKNGGHSTSIRHNLLFKVYGSSD